MKLLKDNGIDVHIATQKEVDDILSLTNRKGIDFKRVFHGTNAIFDHFDHQFLGRGEVHNAFGYGTYTSQVMGIAENYASLVTKSNKKTVLYNGEELTDNIYDKVAQTGTKDAAYQILYDCFNYTSNKKAARAELVNNIK